MSFYSATYKQLFELNADKRVENWFLMKDPFKILTIIAIYLYGIYYYLPKYMKNKKPLNLKNIIQVYNLFQVAACCYLVYGFAVHGWATKYTLGCQLVDFSDDPSAIEMLKLTFWTMILKIIELLETCFFILRHKQNQASKLHVYHHCSTLLFAWITCKYMGGGMATFAMFVNCIIHIVMYSYYFLSALGPTIQKKIAGIKPKITMMQMVQFWVLLVHTLQVYKSDCKMPDLAGFVFLPNLVILFGFFLNFYVKSYKKSKVLVD